MRILAIIGMVFIAGGLLSGIKPDPAFSDIAVFTLGYVEGGILILLIRGIK